MLKIKIHSFLKCIFVRIKNKMETNSSKKFTTLHRFLHWIMAIAMLVLFATGFLRMYWIGKKAVIQAMTSQGIDATEDQMKAVARTLRSSMWEWHELFAKIMIIAVLIRIVYMLVKGVKFPNPFAKISTLKERLQGFIYVYFYIFVLIASFTGVCLEYNWLTSNHETIETVHKWGVYWFPLFVVLHFAGILLAELTNKKGIVSKMIGGE